MTSRERVKRTLKYQHPDRAPRDIWALPGISLFRNDEYKALCERFPSDFCAPEGPLYGRSHRAKPMDGHVGTYVDEWGCGWEVKEPGVVGEVKNPPLKEWESLADYKPPWEMLENADFSGVNKFCAETDLYVRVGSAARPFERMQFLRGSENLFMDLAYGLKEVYIVRDMIHEFFIRDMEMWAETDVDGISFMDDWGTQHALLISPDLWREFYKPLYREYCNIIHAAGKDVWFHSDGHIEAIYPDLIEIGIDAVNSQLFCMDIEGLASKYKGQITFWGEIDRQNILPFGTVDEVREAVRRVRRALDDGSGGVIAQCEWGIADPKENIAAVFETWLE
ncbi:MAG: uroporphyrinogen decarboxylase family protein [bacterium]